MYRTYKIRQVVLSIYYMLMLSVNGCVIEVACYNNYYNIHLVDNVAYNVIVIPSIGSAS